jgi:hypothetical protein
MPGIFSDCCFPSRARTEDIEEAPEGGGNSYEMQALGEPPEARDERAFQTSYQRSGDCVRTFTEDRGDPAVPAQRTEGFVRQSDAASHALNLAIPLTIAQGREHGGIIYRYTRDGVVEHGYTGPAADESEAFWTGIPEISPPPNTKYTGDYHTHPEEFDPNGTRRHNHGFSEHDFDINRALIYGTPAQREELSRRWYGVPPADPQEMEFYLGTATGERYVNIPARPPESPGTVARYQDYPYHWNPDWGTVRLLGEPATSRSR